MAIILLGWAAASAPGSPVRAEAGAAPDYQATGYPAGDNNPAPTTGADSGYPPGDSPSGETATPRSAPTRATPLDQTSTPGPEASFTPTETETLPPDVFRTEDAEIEGALTTPSASETPGPTLTAVFTATVEPSPSQTAQVVAAEKTSSGGLGMDWGLFWIGFSIPVIIGCGAVLYLLDRKPSLFH